MDREALNNRVLFSARPVVKTEWQVTVDDETLTLSDLQVAQMVQEFLRHHSLTLPNGQSDKLRRLAGGWSQ